MTTQHTPGPWTAAIQTGARDTHIISAPQGAYRIAEMTHPDRIAASVRDADARLIAAAPDLLAVLQRCVRFGGLFPDLETEARAAIARATGQ